MPNTGDFSSPGLTEKFNNGIHFLLNVVSKYDLQAEIWLIFLIQPNRKTVRLFVTHSNASFVILLKY